MAQKKITGQQVLVSVEELFNVGGSAAANGDLLTFVDTGAIATFAVTPGSGYTNGVFPGIALTGGSGTGAVGTVTVSGGAVTNVVLTAPGAGFSIGNTLNDGGSLVGGTGFQLTVSSLVPGTWNPQAAPAGGATPPQVLNMTSVGTDFFDEATNFEWTVVPQIGFLQPAYLSYDAYTQQFIVSEPGTFILTLNVRAQATGSWPAGNAALGSTIANMVNTNLSGFATTAHHRGAAQLFDTQRDTMTWVDRYTISATVAGARFAVGTYAGSYGNTGNELSYQVHATFQRVNDPFTLA